MTPPEPDAATMRPAGGLRVALLGTGRMGSAMAERLRDAGVAVVLYNRTPERAAELATRIGATVATTPAEAAAASDVVISMVADDAAVAALYGGPRRGRRRAAGGRRRGGHEHGPARDDRRRRARPSGRRARASWTPRCPGASRPRDRAS